MTHSNSAFIFYVSMAMHHLHLALGECAKDINPEHRVCGEEKDMVEAALFSLGGIKIGDRHAVAK